MSAPLLSTSVVIFMMGLISELVCRLWGGQARGRNQRAVEMAAPGWQDPESS